MEVVWLTPAAWWGLATLAIPVVIHLLTRQQTRRISFPTLRFLQPTRLAALRRRSIHDWPLLLIRAAILASAVAALAAPVFVSSARRADWQMRVARAFVIVPPATGDQTAVAEEVRASFTSAVFGAETHVADGIRDAAGWLAGQPPAVREVVIVGDLRDGTLTAPDLGLLPPSVGIRFLPTPDARDRAVSVDFPFARATLGDVGTTAMYPEMPRRLGAAAVAEFISVRAAPEELAFATAARDAVLARGVRIDRAGERRLLIVFERGETKDLQLKQPAEAAWMRTALARLPGMTGGQRGGTLVVMAGRRASGVETVHAIDRIARMAFEENLRFLEPRRIPAAILARWSRPPQLTGDGVVTDEGDRRWLWGLALVLLGVESFVRRSAKREADEEEAGEEQRVA
jgi:hypothetical protein